MSFAIGGRGDMYVLDQVNGRIARLDAGGAWQSTIPLDATTAQDIAVGEDGTVAVLDRFGGKDVTLFDDDGRKLGTLPLTGDGIEGAGEVTGIFVDGNDVYAEREHSALVKIGDTSGNPAAERSEIPGRPTRDGSAFISAGITDAEAGRTYVAANARPSEDHLFTREIQFEEGVLSLQLLDSDKKGTIYFAAETREGESETAVILVCLSLSDGTQRGSAILPANEMPEESFRDFVVLDAGGVVYAHRTEEGVSYTQYDCD